MKVLVTLSTGVESTAVLNYAINEYGLENVTAFTSIVEGPSDVRGLFLPTEVYAKKIIEYYGVKHVFIRHQVEPDTLYASFDGFHNMMWSHDAIMLCMSTDYDKFLYGKNSQEGRHLGVLLFENIFRETMHTRWIVSEGKAVTTPIETPLEYLTKKQQYYSIPAEIRQYVWTCVNYQTRNQDSTVFTACGKCKKCLEFERLVTNG